MCQDEIAHTHTSHGNKTKKTWYITYEFVIVATVHILQSITIMQAKQWHAADDGQFVLLFPAIFNSPLLKSALKMFECECIWSWPDWIATYYYYSPGLRSICIISIRMHCTAYNTLDVMYGFIIMAIIIIAVV